MLGFTNALLQGGRGIVFPVPFDMKIHLWNIQNLVNNHRWRVSILEDGPGAKPPTLFDGGDEFDLTPRSREPEPSPLSTPASRKLRPILGVKRREAMSLTPRAVPSQPTLTTTAQRSPRPILRHPPHFEIQPREPPQSAWVESVEELTSLERKCPSPILSSRDEEAIFRHFGMMAWMWKRDPAQQSPKEIAAKFKHMYSDFCVTELVAENTPVAGGFNSSEKNFDVPDVPNGLLTGGMSTDSNNVFDTVDVDAQLEEAASLSEVNLPLEDADVDAVGDTPPPRRRGRRRHYVEFTLDKRRTGHGDALAIIRSALGLKFDQITAAGIKDFNAMTLQRVRVEGVSAERVRGLNSFFKERGHKMVVSDFKYKERPLVQGSDLYGNRFKVTLRDVSCTEDEFAQAIEHVKANGAPNYYGTQRFSWSAGQKDAALAGPLHHNWLLFAFRFLDFTEKKHSLRELLQRRQVYPKREQNMFRRRMVHYLRQAGVEPTMLDEYSFFKKEPRNLADDPIGSYIAARHASVGGMGGKQNRLLTRPSFVLEAIKAAYNDIPAQSRRMQCAGVVSYLWNQLLSARIHHFGSQVLEGDVVIVPGLGANQFEPPGIDISITSAIDEDNPPLTGAEKALRFALVTAANKHLFSPADVVLPSFTFGNLPLPQNCMRDLYHAVSSHYALTWGNKVGSDILNGPRRALVRPENVSFKYFPSSSEHAAAQKARGWHSYEEPRGTDGGPVVELHFDLNSGCYATVVLTEILRLSQCIGSATTKTWPRPACEWDEGAQDPHWVETETAVYGHAADSREDDTRTHEEKMADDTSPPTIEDPHARIARWSEYNLKHESERRAERQEASARRMFEQGLLDTMGDEELHGYIGAHNIQAQPNAQTKTIFKHLARRNKAGRALLPPRLRRGSATKADKIKPNFTLLSHDTWNFQ